MPDNVLVIPSNMTRKVVGSQGSTISRLREKYGCDIQLPGREHRGATATVTITGRDVAGCKAEIAGIVGVDPTKNPSGKGKGEAADDGFTTVTKAKNKRRGSRDEGREERPPFATPDEAEQWCSNQIKYSCSPSPCTRTEQIHICRYSVLVSSKFMLLCQVPPRRGQAAPESGGQRRQG